MSINIQDLEKRIKQRGNIQVLDNGITVISENVPGSGLVTGNIQLQVGSAYESPQDHGIFHLLEHVSFGGSRRYSDRNARNMQSAMIGLEIEACTGSLNIQYPVRGSNRDGYLLLENFAESLSLVTDLMFFPRIDEDSIRREVSVVRQEILEAEKKKLCDLYGLVNKAVYGRLYSCNPAFLKDDGLGTFESISQISTATMAVCHNQYFVGANTDVTLLGDLESGLMSTIMTTLEEIPTGVVAQQIPVRSEAGFIGREQMIFPLPMPGKTEIRVYFPVSPLHVIDSDTVHFLRYIFGGNFNSLLFRDLREERGLVYGLHSQIEGHELSRYLKVSFSVEPQKVDEALEALDFNIDKLKQGMFDERFVAAYKASRLPGILADVQKPGWIQQELLERRDKERFGYESTSWQRLKPTMAVTKADVVRAANEYLGENRLTVILK